MKWVSIKETKPKVELNFETIKEKELISKPLWIKVSRRKNRIDQDKEYLEGFYVVNNDIEMWCFQNKFDQREYFPIEKGSYWRLRGKDYGSK
jgi:hypothetical protein